MIYLIRAIAAFIAASLAAGFLFHRVFPADASVALGYLVGLFASLAGCGGCAAFLGWLDGEAPRELHGWKRYFSFSTDHKVIGIQYLIATLVLFGVAGIMALIMRTELAQAGMQFLSFKSYNTIMSTHGIGMIIVAIVGIMGSLGNFAVPLMIGADDMAFPRLNALSFWMLVPAIVALLAGPLFGGFDFGWTAYAPLSVRGPLGKLIFVLAFVTVGFSSIFGAVNFLTTILGMRAKGMSLGRMPIFVWSVFSASMIAVMATSVIASSLIMVIFDRALSTAFFNPAQGGSAIMYQHLFWFYSHPAVYIMILPAFGVILEIIPVFSRKPLFAYKLTAASLFGIVVMSFLVWAHHMFTSGMWDTLSLPFMITTELISVPTGVVFLSALGTLWLGKLRFPVPMLFALGVLANFLIGGLTGIFLADVPTDLHLHDTWFIVAHFHYTIMGGSVFAFFAGIYYWFPKMTGRMLDETLGKIHFWCFFLGFNGVFLPMFWLGAHGMRRRVADFPVEMQPTQMWISAVALVVAVSVAIFLHNLARSRRKGKKAGKNPWGAKTLEWTVDSPPPHGNFPKPPVVSEGPYEYGKA